MKNLFKKLPKKEKAIFSSGSLAKEVIKGLSPDLNQSAKEIYEARKEIEKRKADLEHFYHLTVGRELKMIELKKEIKELGEKRKKEE